MPHRIPKQGKPNRELQTAVLDEARERALQLQQRDEDKTDRSVTLPHGDPQREHLRREPGVDRAPRRGGDEPLADEGEEGPGPAEGRTDNRAGG